jgi:CDP-paratose 2-epimerase
MSLAQLNSWCNDRFGVHEPGSDVRPRPYDLPWIVMDNNEATRDFDWNPTIPMVDILSQIADHASENPDWLQRSGL